MIKFIRNFRKNLLSQGNTGKYFKYAIGEIFLVAIGILIALQINNWNQNNKNEIKERRYLGDLIQDLKRDSLSLHMMTKEFEQAVKSKKILEERFNTSSKQIDSAVYHLEKQWVLSFDFIPHVTTIEELKSSSNLDLITNINLRRKLVSLYNHYDELIQKLALGKDKSQNLIDIISRYTVDINSPTNVEINNLFKNTYFTNKVRLNYLMTLNTATTTALKECAQTMTMLRKEYNKG